MSPHFYKNPLLNSIRFWLQKIYHNPSDYGNRKRKKNVLDKNSGKFANPELLPKNAAVFKIGIRKHQSATDDIIFIDGEVGEIF